MIIPAVHAMPRAAAGLRPWLMAAGLALCGHVAVLEGLVVAERSGRAALKPPPRVQSFELTRRPAAAAAQPVTQSALAPSRSPVQLTAAARTGLAQVGSPAPAADGKATAPPRPSLTTPSGPASERPTDGVPEHESAAPTGAAPGSGVAGARWAGTGAGPGEERQPLSSAGEGDSGRPAPMLAARLPPPFELALGARRGNLEGGGILRFETGHEAGQEGQYHGSLVLTTDGKPWIEWHSRGRIDEESGLQPERFTDRRRGRSARAAIFDREAGQIRYSGSAGAHRLEPQAQDRLSWLVQLPALFIAQPDLRRPGARVSLPVTGVYGDAFRWHFDCPGLQPTPGHDTPAALAWYCVREPTQPYDTRVEVWLDASEPHLPVHVRLRPVPAGEPLNLWRMAPS